MDNERIRSICMALPHAAETLNWGNCLVYWAGAREMGGKMFAITNADGAGDYVLSFHAGPERYHELLEVEGIHPAPHLARAYWVALDRWSVLRPREIEAALEQAHQLVFARLPKRARALLELPEEERNQPAALARKPKSPAKKKA